MAPLSEVLAGIKQHVGLEMERLHVSGGDMRAVECIRAGESCSFSTGPKKEYNIAGGALTDRLEQAISSVVARPTLRLVHREDVARIMRLELSAFLFLTDEYNRAQGSVGWDTRFGWLQDRRRNLRLWLDKPAKLRKLRRRTKPSFKFSMSDSSDEKENRGPVRSLIDMLSEETQEVVSKDGEVEVVCAGSSTHVSESTEEEDEAAVATSTPLANSPRVVRWSLSPIGNCT